MHRLQVKSMLSLVGTERVQLLSPAKGIDRLGLTEQNETALCGSAIGATQIPKL